MWTRGKTDGAACKSTKAFPRRVMLESTGLVLQQHIITAARDTYTPALFLLTFFKRNKTLVEPGIRSNMDQSRAHGENQNTCLTSTVLTSPSLQIWTHPERTTEHSKESHTVPAPLGIPAASLERKLNFK